MRSNGPEPPWLVPAPWPRPGCSSPAPPAPGRELRARGREERRQLRKGAGLREEEDKAEGEERERNERRGASDLENIGRETSVAFLSRVMAPPGTKRLHFVPAAGSTRDKRATGPFVPVGATTRDKRPIFLSRLVSPTGTKGPCPPLARLAIGPGIKATFCPGPKDSRDKWPGTKTYSVIV